MDSKTIHSTIDAPPGVPGVSKNKIFLQIKLLSSCAKIDPKLQKLQKTFKIENRCQKTMFSYTFSNTPQIGLNISSPKYQNIVKGVLLDILTPLAPLGTRQ